MASTYNLLSIFRVSSNYYRGILQFSRKSHYHSDLLYHTHSSQRLITKLDTKAMEKITPENRKKSDNSVKYTIICLGMLIGTTVSYFILTYGSAQIDNEGNEIRDEFSELPLWQQYFSRSKHQVEKFTRLIQEPSREKLLPDPLKFPYQQPSYTLILELTNILVHPDWTYRTGWRFKKRPGIDYLLENLAGLYEIVIFTAEQGVVVFPLVEALDSKNLISYKLVRDATHFVNGYHVKNLDKLNRDLKKVIVIDWTDESVKFHNDNLFKIEKWNGDDDNTLVELTSFLIAIAQNEVDDVREVLKYYKTFDNPLETFKQKQQDIFKEETTEKSILPKKSYFF